jgi:hypothetical protein
MKTANPFTRNVNDRCCGNCRYAKERGGQLECNLIPEQRASVAANSNVSADDFCDQHDYRELPAEAA